MQSNLGCLLRSLRERRELSVEQAALEADIAPSTLYHWEQGKYQPRLPELQAVLRTLNASDEVLSNVLALIKAPRAIQAQQERLADADMDARMPAWGDLLAALRNRRGFTAAQVAAALRVSPASVTRWEQSRQVPAPDRLDELLTLLHASPQERAALQSDTLCLPFPLADGARDTEHCHAYLDGLRQGADQQKDFPGDLCYLALEAHLVQGQVRQGKAQGAERALLIQVWTQHAQYLMWHGRLKEMNVYARRVVEATPPGAPGDACLIQALGMTAHYVAHGTKKRDFDGAAAYLAGQKELASRYRDGATLFRDMGEYYGLAGRSEEGTRLAQRARHMAEERGDVEGSRMGRLIEARTLIIGGDAEAALALLPPDDVGLPGARLYEMLERARALLLLQDRSSASWWLTQYYDLIATSGLEHLRAHADYLACQL